MSKKSIIKQDLLRRKIQEYFSKNPKAKSVIIKADVGEAKTLWKVVRENKKFKVVEVNTRRDEYIIESGINVVQEASAEFANISKMFTQAMSPPFDHAKLSNALKLANTSIGKIVDPNEKNQVGSMIGALTQMVDSTTAGGGSSVQRTSMTASRPVGSMQMSGKKNVGKVVSEAESEKDSKKKDSEKKTQQKPKKDSEKKTQQKPKKDPTPKDKIEPSNDPEQLGDLETSSNTEAPQDDAPIKQLSSEELVVSKNLTGQTIKAANIELTPEGGELTLDLVNSGIPSKLQWKKNGKVVFNSNGRPYVLSNEQE